MNPSGGLNLFGWNLSFDRGRIVFAKLNHHPFLTLMLLLPWAYYDPSEYDGFAGYNRVFKIHADTQVEFTSDPETDFRYVKVVVLGFGASFTYQGSY